MTDSLARRRESFQATIAAHQTYVETGFDTLLRSAHAMKAALEAGNKVIVFGNGGSAADAQHFAAELVGRFLKERRALGRRGDVALGITTSGTSKNVLAGALERSPTSPSRRPPTARRGSRSCTARFSTRFAKSSNQGCEPHHAFLIPDSHFLII